MLASVCALVQKTASNGAAGVQNGAGNASAGSEEATALKDGCSRHDEATYDENDDDEAAATTGSSAADQQNQMTKSKKRRLKRLQKKKRADAQASAGPRISWGDVTECLFTRQLGLDGVPKSGGYPLGLGEFLEADVVPLAEHIANHQAVLRRRMQALDSTAASLSITDEEMVFETRQWDFKRHVSNPLFKPLREPARADLLQHLNTKQSAINEMTHQLDKLRASAKSSHCSCKPMKSLDKLSITKLKQELRSRGFTAGELEPRSKTELMALLREKVRDEPLCNANNCECFRQGVECHFDICGCCHKSSQLQQCGNPNGKYEYDGREVNIFRKRLLFPDTWMELITEDAPRSRARGDSVISHADSVASVDSDSVLSAAIAAAAAVSAAKAALNESETKKAELELEVEVEVENVTKEGRIPSPTPEMGVEGQLDQGPSSTDGAPAAPDLTKQLWQLLRGESPTHIPSLDSEHCIPEVCTAGKDTMDKDAAMSAANVPVDGQRCRPRTTGRSASSNNATSPRKKKMWKAKEKPASHEGSNGGRIHLSK